jgi:hypothetical protein
LIRSWAATAGDHLYGGDGDDTLHGGGNTVRVIGRVLVRLIDKYGAISEMLE